MNTFTYTFDFGAKPAFLIDAWFKKAVGPVLVISIIFFPLTTFTSHWITKFIFPSIAAGAIIIFIGIYVYRRQISIRRIKHIKNSVFQYEINDIGIRYQNELGEGIIKWGFKGKLIRLKKFFLLQSNEIGLLPIPVDTPPEILTFVEDQLKSNKELKQDANKPSS
jgi:hypothetical protein